MTRRLLTLLLLVLPLFTARAAAEAPAPDWGNLGKERAGLEENASQARKDEQAAVAELFLLNRTLDEIRRAIARLDQEIGTVSAEQTAAEAKRDRLEAERKQTQAQFGRRARYYHEQGTFAPVGFLLQSSTLGDFLLRIDILSMVMQRDARLIRELRTLKAAVEEQEKVLAAKRAELVALREKQSGQEERLKGEIAHKERVLASLKEQRSGVETRVAELEQVWATAAEPVLAAFGKSLQTVALRVKDLTPDSVQFSLVPPGATVKVSEQNLNQFVAQDGDMKGLSFRLRPGEANLEGSFGGVKVSIAGQFSIKGKTVLRYEPKEIRFVDFRLPPSVTEELLASGRLDIDYSALIGPWAMQEIRMEDAALVVKAGLK